MKTSSRILPIALSLLIFACSDQAPSEADSAVSGTEVPATAQTSNEDTRAYPQAVYWGDTHLHTANSVDAFGFGNRLDTEAALRFARGEEVTSTRGVKAQLTRPLDFLVISDHSDALGATKELYEAPRLLVRDPLLREWWDKMHNSPEGGLEVTSELISRAATGDLPKALTDAEQQNKRVGKLWRAHNKTLERYNEPGKFTAFSGFEYTPMPQGNNLHRVVMFRDGVDKTNSILPFPSFSNPDPENLWAWMAKYETENQGQVLAMPHNSNISNGLMFAMTKLDGSPIDQAYAEIRAKYEPVVEITQIKGDSESHPFLSPNDEFASFGIQGWDKCNLSCTEEMATDSYGGSYVRAALKRGLQLERYTGTNPYAFGVIGSTDSHTSLATADENNFYGKHTGNEIDVENRAVTPQNLGTRKGRFGWNYLASGYAAAWATDNTREAIFDAFNRREVYATTGPRISVRLFAGFDLSSADSQANLVKAGYEKGVPMGGELSDANGRSPSFLISALMDPESANLDRVQIIKGWIDADGETHEQIINVTWASSDSRLLDQAGQIAPVGNTVDVSNGTWANTIGAPELRGYWQDPEFDPAQNAFYYARVLEIPTPTWAVLDAVKYGIKLREDTVTTQQERAYTSPIWYHAN